MARAIRTGRQSGFTLIELLVVLSIMSILLTMVVPRYFHHIDMAKETVLREDLTNLRDAIDKYRGDTGHFPASLDDLVTSHYIRAVPPDPITGRVDSWQMISRDDEDGVADVKSGADGVASDGTPFNAL